MFGKRPSHIAARTIAVAIPTQVYISAFHPVHIGIFLAALLFGMNA
ncbi:hypothetical protein [Asticcacaulis sp. 201]|nr:hypothetical protein [Asticcacaulis sp. 201]MDV6329659.1 hypothetical protein [Asticcacaulis sp. 201]